MNRLAGQCAIVTGAARGLGLAIARRFAAEGARVVLADRDGPRVAQAAQELGQTAMQVDVSRRADVDRLVDRVVGTHGTVDILVNNAGIFRSHPMLTLTEADFDELMTVNLKSALFAIQAVAPQMMAAGKGTIVNVASLAAVLGTPGSLAYCTSKAALVQLTNVAALELAGHGIRVNAIAPGTFDTDMAAGAYADPDAMRRVLSRTPLGRLGDPDEAAGAVLFLATADSGYITGKTIFIDGGRMGLNLTV